MSLTLGPFHLLSTAGSLRDLAWGKGRTDGLQGVDDRLPQPNSLRRAGEETKTAVAAATELLRATGTAVSERLGLYVGQQQIALDYCTRFVESSYRDGPKLASPMLFSESVANNVATHLSLTLGLRGIAQTFIGTRAAGIQAVRGAAEDVAGGHVDVGLIVVLGVATSLTRDAYLSVYRPFQRRSRPDVRFLRGAVAMLVRRDAPGQPRLLHTGVCCAGRDAEAQARAVGGVWSEAAGRLKPGTRVVDSVLDLAGESGRAVIRQSAAPAPSGPDIGESYALDPFVRLMLDGALHPGPAGRAAVCLGEEGTAAVLALDGPPPVLEV